MGTNKVTPRFAAFSFAHQVLRSLVSSFKIIGPHILHGDINARNVLFMRKWKLCQLNENGDGGHSWTHYKSRATADARARDLSAQGLLVEGPKVTIKAGLVDFGLSRQQNNWLWPRGYGPFEGLWTPPNDLHGRNFELNGMGGWAFMRVAGDFRYCPPSTFQATGSNTCTAWMLLASAAHVWGSSCMVLRSSRWRAGAIGTTCAAAGSSTGSWSSISSPLSGAAIGPSSSKRRPREGFVKHWNKSSQAFVKRWNNPSRRLPSMRLQKNRSSFGRSCAS